MKVGRCKYVLVNQNGGVLNDPILLKVTKLNIGFSCNSDILWAQGLLANKIIMLR